MTSWKFVRSTSTPIAHKLNSFTGIVYPSSYNSLKDDDAQPVVADEHI